MLLMPKDHVPVLRQTEGIIVELFAEPAHEVSDLVLDLSQLCLGLLSHLDHVELRIDVAWQNESIFCTDTSEKCTNMDALND